jgi:hypothetical protein
VADEQSRREAPADLVAFYDEFWREEATHHVLFLQLAERSLERAGHKDAAGTVAARVAVFAAHEAAVLAALPLRPRIHGRSIAPELDRVADAEGRWPKLEGAWGARPIA